MKRGTICAGDGCTLAYELSGPETAPVLVLSNSLGTTMAMWDPQIDALRQHFRVLRYDTRGHGGSGAPPGGYSLDRLGRDVVELVDALGISTFFFCGLSLGGMVGQWLGWRLPGQLERVVIANSSPFMGPPAGWDARIRTVRERGMAEMVAPVIERWFTPAFAADPARVATFVRDFEATSEQGYAGCCAAIRDMDMRALLSLITVPTLVIGGSLDPATPPSHTDELVRGIAGSRCIMLDAAHLSNVEQPTRFSRAVLDFLLA